jgi:hypothetical protein
MTNEQIWIYLWSISENISTALQVIGVLGSIFGLFGAIAITTMVLDKECSKWFLLLWISYLIFPTIFFISLLIPSKNDIALIWAAPYLKAGAEKVVTNEKLNKIPDNIMELTNIYLEEQIKEIKSNKE